MLYRMDALTMMSLRQWWEKEIQKLWQRKILRYSRGCQSWGGKGASSDKCGGSVEESIEEKGGKTKEIGNEGIGQGVAEV